MRKPRDLQNYVTTKWAAKGLRQIADKLEKTASKGMLIKWRLNISRYIPEDYR